MYKNEKETKLRHQVLSSDLTAVAFLKDAKHKRENVFGVFSPSRNYHFQAPTKQDAQEWVDLIRKEARMEEEEEEMFLGSPMARSVSPGGLMSRLTNRRAPALDDRDAERVLSSSPETYGPPAPGFIRGVSRRKPSTIDSSGMSGNELLSQSDFSDNEMPRGQGASGDSFAVQFPLEGSLPNAGALTSRPIAGNRSASQISIGNPNGSAPEQDPDRVIWQGWLWLLRSKRGVKQWKDMWGVLRPRNLILYKDGSEYTAQWIVELSVVVDVVDTDPVSRSKENCLQIITEEKSYRFCTHDEESLVQFIGAFKSLLAKRRGLEARAAASTS